MSFAQGFARQLARPHGVAGRLLGTAMDLANRVPTRAALDLLDPRDGERVIDVGCGTGAALADILRRADCIAMGVDRSPQMIAAAGRKLGAHARLVEAALGELPLPDDSFDAGLALNMLYFCDEDGRMLADFRRILRPGGRIVAYVTHGEDMQDWFFTGAGYHRLLDETTLAEAFRTGGFAPDNISISEVPVSRGIRGLLAMAIK